jgi:hypothetical protein
VHRSLPEKRKTITRTVKTHTRTAHRGSWGWKRQTAAYDQPPARHSAPSAASIVVAGCRLPDAGGRTPATRNNAQERWGGGRRWGAGAGKGPDKYTRLGERDGRAAAEVVVVGLWAENFEKETSPYQYGDGTGPRRVVQVQSKLFHPAFFFFRVQPFLPSNGSGSRSSFYSQQTEGQS